MRFCSRCGFTLTGVVALLENNGALPPTPAQPERSPISRNRIMLEGGALAVFASALAFIATFWFNASGVYEGIAKVSALVFLILSFIGLIRFLYGFLAVKDYAEPKTASLSAAQIPPALRHGAAYPALPPQQSIPISDYPLRQTTKEIRPQPSVTENTTRLLDE
ncbi:MAG TPA: hypothetical protein VGN90_09160 [Pyrinomonadaceae bacterium]|jgi:hypothetical protein|nr:hypothetical protein [Pyrinomonadaceae bacterium]